MRGDVPAGRIPSSFLTHRRRTHSKTFPGIELLTRRFLADNLDEMEVVLIGYRGSGKTTVGRKLADRMWSNFIDIDDLIVARAGKSIRQIFAEDGEERYRDMETDCLREALKLDAAVLGLGGGTVVREENRKLLKESGIKIIYLKCDPKVLLKRLENDPKSAETRPPLTPLGGGIEEIKLMIEQREPWYREVMKAELDVSNLTPEEALVYVTRLM
jgi:shikimate kinase